MFDVFAADRRLQVVEYHVVLALAGHGVKELPHLLFSQPRGGRGGYAMDETRHGLGQSRSTCTRPVLGNHEPGTFCVDELIHEHAYQGRYGHREAALTIREFELSKQVVEHRPGTFKRHALVEVQGVQGQGGGLLVVTFAQQLNTPVLAHHREVHGMNATQRAQVFMEIP